MWNNNVYAEYNLKGLEFCQKLTKLRFKTKRQTTPPLITLANTNSIARCQHLKFLALSGDFDLSQLALEKLTDLEFDSNHVLQNLNFLKNSNKLSHFSAKNCDQLSDITTLNLYENLATVHIENCVLIQNYSFLNDVKNLIYFRFINIYNKPQLDFSGLGRSKGLKILEINNCHPPDFSFLQSLENLTELTLKNIEGTSSSFINICVAAIVWNT